MSLCNKEIYIMEVKRVPSPDDGDSISSQVPPEVAAAQGPLTLKFDPENLKLNKRHTKILGTLNKKTSNEMLTEYIKAGMDGIRVFCDDGYENVTRLIETARTASHNMSRRIVVSIELRCKIFTSKLVSRVEKDVCRTNRKRLEHASQAWRETHDIYR